ncbi:SNRPG [Acanthosepion pharaonis]|uniref:Small nuclear ribonucleoprotein G n=1 Tax=Acanthosepion pharaonis TaxID=158019 RepID=A0A812BX00_ACAPH|nr:SNRPG [Sepia pharaonis]
MHCDASAFTWGLSVSISCRFGTASLAAASIPIPLNFQRGSSGMSLISDTEGSWQDSSHPSLLHFGIDKRSKELTSGVLSTMSKAHPPELKKYMERRLSLKLNGGRTVSGILRGFDPFMNLVIDECVEETKSGERNPIGMVAVRGNSIVLLEALDRVS